MWPDQKPWTDLSVYLFDWSDFVCILVLVVLLMYARAIVQRWSRLFFSRRVAKHDLTKSSESTWKVCFYSISLIWGVKLLASRDWVWTYSYDALFLHVPELYLNPERVDRDVYFFYMFQMGFYVHSIHCHLFLETRRADFVEMLAHHLATLALLFLSFSSRFLAAGALIVVAHDIADLLFEIAKQFIYNKLDLLANIWFAAWVLTWIVTRLIYFPIYILRGSIWGIAKRIGQYPHFATNATMLCVLQLLHVFWTIMIFRMIVRMLFGAEKVRDTREDDDESNEKET